MKTKHCRVTYKGFRYEILKDGSVHAMWADNSSIADNVPVTGRPGEFAIGPQVADEALAKAVRAEANRQRRNRNARERHQAMTDLGLKRVRGALGGVYYE